MHFDLFATLKLVKFSIGEFMHSVRQEAVAGLFYPKQSAQLQAQVDQFLGTAEERDQPKLPKVLVVPHAGLRYSGATAGLAYSRLNAYSDKINKVVMIGPSHRVRFAGVALPSVAAVRTPLGEIPIAHAFVSSLVESGLVTIRDDAHAAEHSLEVQWPFLQRALGKFELIPLCVGNASPHHIMEIIAQLWGGEDTIIVVSTDLSHFHPQSEAVELDAQSIARIKVNDWHLSGADACGFQGLNGALKLLSLLNIQLENINYSHSGQLGGDPNRVVGYGAFACSVDPGLSLNDRSKLTDSDKELLRALALQAIQSCVNGKRLSVSIDSYPLSLQRFGATFVSVYKHGGLRGCIGSLQAHQPLALDVAANAVKSVSQDPRFPKVTPNELPSLTLEISVLSRPSLLPCKDEQDLIQQLRPGVDGVILQAGNRRSTFLPLVWGSIPDAATFVSRLKQKGGFGATEWPDDMRVFRYQADKF